MLKPTFHRDLTVTYWSVYRQVWVREPADRICDAELAAMSESERKRIDRMVEKICA